MFGIYIHIPFCTKKCAYCDFYSIAYLANKDAYLNALVKEIKYRDVELPSQKVSTIYFGGGTPSLLSLEDFEIIFTAINNTFDTSSCTEVTVEVNPDDVTEDFINGLKHLGVNRVSVGIQSFNDNTLSFMGRRHNSAQAVKAVKDIQKAGINNISIDLIYGIPDMSDKEWLYSIQQALDLKVQHISAYHLTFEPNTPFYKRLQRKEIVEINDKDSVNQYNVLVAELNEGGYIDYEISNFCLPDKASKHNSNYWYGKDYMGFGPSAHSYNGELRKWNISNLSTYIESINQQSEFFEKEKLSDVDIYNETIMLRLRTKEGLDLDVFRATLKDDTLNYFEGVLQNNLNNKWLLIEDGYIKVTQEHKFLTDKIISDFFLV